MRRGGHGRFGEREGRKGSKRRHGGMRGEEWEGKEWGRERVVRRKNGEGKDWWGRAATTAMVVAVAAVAAVAAAAGDVVDRTDFYTYCEGDLL